MPKHGCLPSVPLALIYGLTPQAHARGTGPENKFYCSYLHDRTMVGNGCDENDKVLKTAFDKHRNLLRQHSRQGGSDARVIATDIELSTVSRQLNDKR